MALLRSSTARGISRVHVDDEADSCVSCILGRSVSYNLGLWKHSQRLDEAVSVFHFNNIP